MRFQEKDAMSSEVENPSGRFLTNRVTTTQTRKQFTNRLSEYCHPFIILDRSPLTNWCTISELFALPTNQTIDSTPSTDHHSLPSFVAFLLIASTKDDLRFLITNIFFPSQGLSAERLQHTGSTLLLSRRHSGLDPESRSRPPRRARTPTTLDPPLHSANSCTIIATWTTQDWPNHAS